MADPFVAEIRIFAGNFAPYGWALCNGQTMPISQNTALFSLLGTTYGGNGISNFALPDLQGLSPLQAGQGPGLSQCFLGETSGEQAVTLLQTEMPAHTHQVKASTGTGLTIPYPSNSLGSVPRGRPAIYADTGKVSMSASATSIAGGGAPHNNMMPYLGLIFIIALQGVYPPRW